MTVSYLILLKDEFILNDQFNFWLQERGEDHAAWEEEQKRLDREWYGLDEGYDETHNPFSGVSIEYTRYRCFRACLIRGQKVWFDKENNLIFVSSLSFTDKLIF